LLTGALILTGFSARPTRAGNPNSAFSVQSDGDGQLYEISLIDGTARALTPTGFGDIEALTFTPNIFTEPDLSLIHLYGADSESDQIVELFANTPGEAIGPVVDEFGDPIDIDDPGLSFDPSGNRLLMTNNEPDDSSLLYDLAAPANVGEPVVATVIGVLSQPVTGLATDGSTLFGLGGSGQLEIPTNNLLILDPDLADPTTDAIVGEVGTLGTFFNIIDGGIDFDQFGTLWGIDDGSDPDGDGASHLFPISTTPADPSQLVDPASILTVTLGGKPISGFEGLAIGPSLGEPPPPSECSGEVRLSTKRVKFGNVRLRKNKNGVVRGFTIRNRSKDEDLVIFAIDSDNDEFEVANGDPAEVGPLTLGPGEHRVVAIRFTPSKRGLRKGTITVETSDCKNDTVELHVQGHGKR